MDAVRTLKKLSVGAVHSVFKPGDVVHTPGHNRRMGCVLITSGSGVWKREEMVIRPRLVSYTCTTVAQGLAIKLLFVRYRT